MPTKILFQCGDITEAAVDAVVNAANTELTLEAGVALAIRRRGGEGIREECERLAPIPLGAAVVTTAGALKAFYVVHAAVLRPGERATADSVHLATHHTLERAEEKAYKSIAFPALGAGTGGLALEECAEIMLREVLEHLKSRSSLEKIHFVLFDETARQIFEGVYQRLAAPRKAESA